MAINWNEILEQAIVGKLISTLVDDGFRIEVSDQDGGGLFVYAVPNGGNKPRGGFKHWVRLVPGNGPDVISDFSVNLTDILKPLNDFAAGFHQ